MKLKKRSVRVFWLFQDHPGETSSLSLNKKNLEVIGSHLATMTGSQTDNKIKIEQKDKGGKKVGKNSDIKSLTPILPQFCKTRNLPNHLNQIGFRTLLLAAEHNPNSHGARCHLLGRECRWTTKRVDLEKCCWKFSKERELWSLHAAILEVSLWIVWISSTGEEVKALEKAQSREARFEQPLPFSICVCFGNSCNLSEPQFPPLWKRGNNTHVKGLCEGYCVKNVLGSGMWCFLSLLFAFSLVAT